MAQRTPVFSWLLAVIVLVAVGAGGYWFWRKAMAPEPAPVAALPPPAPASSAPSNPVVQHPIGAAGPASPSSAPLPLLSDSDTLAAEGLSDLAGIGNLDGLLLRQQVIGRIVATVDALPRHSLATRLLPVKTAGGKFLVSSDGNIDPKNEARYARYMAVVEHVNPRAAAAWYVRFYPLFQQAYKELGYPDGYFNDRLVVAIDDMLAAPEPKGPIAVVEDRGHYVFTDPQLQSASVGQKILIRQGPDGEAKAKAKLRELRDAITAAKAH